MMVASDFDRFPARQSVLIFILCLTDSFASAEFYSKCDGHGPESMPLSPNEDKEHCACGLRYLHKMGSELPCRLRVPLFTLAHYSSDRPETRLEESSGFVVILLQTRRACNTDELYFKRRYVLVVWPRRG